MPDATDSSPLPEKAQGTPNPPVGQDSHVNNCVHLWLEWVSLSILASVVGTKSNRGIQVLWEDDQCRR